MALPTRVRRALAVAVAGLLGSTALTAPPAAAATGPGLTGATAPASRHTVTLITGEKADLVTDAAGRSRVSLQPDEQGRIPVHFTRQVNGDQYVFPQRAAAALAAGSVDKALFNISALVRQGYDDQGAKALPVIAVYRDQQTADLSAPARSRAAGVKSLKAVHGVAYRADKAAANRTWDTLVDRAGNGRDGLAKLWLDQKVKATLESETGQIGAPAAWALGLGGQGVKVAVLDTGIDADHPDLAGRVLDARNFTSETTGTPDTDVHDAVGHGTFVASEIAGTGAASQGAQRGVAAEAGLLVGKVLDDYGSGTDSQIIAGMQWAVDSGADVASMSLGSAEPTDCTDPMSVAAQNLAKSSKTLFVVAAGNLGRYQSVSSPGCAPDVLTVGAVDSVDRTASFSSRGSVTGVHTLKPEIAAPGVDVTAAAAGGRGVYAYTAMSGTSMATPLVAGAAALLKQRHPDWTADRLKAALVSSADPTLAGDVQQIGGGRLRVGQAVRQTVLGSPAVGFGRFGWPQVKADTRTVQLPYTNTGDAPVRLRLTVQRTDGDDDSAIGSRIVRLGRESVTVPAGATVQVPLTLDPTARLTGGQYGDVTGRVLATDEAGRTVSTPFNAYVEPETLSVRVKLTDRDGRPATGDTGSSVDLIDISQSTGQRAAPDANGDITLRLRPGVFSLTGFVVTPDHRDATGEAAPRSVAAMAMPEFRLTKDTVLTLDARKADRVEVRADRTVRTLDATLELSRWWGDKWVDAIGARIGNAPVELYSWGSGKASTGGFEAGSYLRLGAPPVVFTGAGVTLEPNYLPYAAEAHLPAAGSAGLVAARSASAADLAAAGVTGRLVLLPDDGTDANQVSANAQAAGAVAVLTYRPTPGSFRKNDISTQAPVFQITADQAAELTARLARGTVTLDWVSTPDSPYVYNLAFHDAQQVRGSQRRTVRDRELATVTETWHSLGAATHMFEYADAVRPWNPYAQIPAFQGLVAAPLTRTAYYTADDGQWAHAVQSSWPFAEYLTDLNRSYRKGESRTEEWYRGVLRPTAGTGTDGAARLVGERQGDRIGVDFSRSLWNDADPDHTGTMSNFGDAAGVELLADGTSLGESWYGPFNVWELPTGDARYLLRLTQQRFHHRDVWQRSSAVRTEFSFRSHGDPAVYSQALPLLFPSYDLPVDADNTVAAGPLRIGLSATGQAGWTPGPLGSATLAYSYDDGSTWTPGTLTRSQGRWTAAVDHTGVAAGTKVALRVTLTAADGVSVTQTVADAYAVR
ncbi:subtilisin family serine protease [Kitasatospora gansuensis]|uniref:Subtilisin family serine protease n=1 Tax=Kitasatospora gansuensis TaxID=258050 RepID=A0A7W7S749_9ACTN|nr:S8 family serine peptidase [Kitasatospora gansuensis]MBB4945100.1 subtilisin family serine protease [Kitasatospora gansuensis]